MEEKLSICCTAFPDERFTYDDDTDIGVCGHCKEWSKFLTESESDDCVIINLK